MIDRVRSLLEGLQIGSHIEITTDKGKTHSGTLVSFDEYFLKIETVSDSQKINTSEISTWRQPKQELEDRSLEVQPEGREYLYRYGNLQVSSDLDQLLERAQHYYNMRDYCNAMHELKKLPSEYPGLRQLLEKSMQARKKQIEDQAKKDVILLETRSNVSVNKTEADQLFAQAKDYLDNSDHSNAINRIKRVLKIDSEYPGAQAFLERCREAQRQYQTQGDSSETNYFTQAQSATSHEEAIKYLRLAIDHGQRVHSAVKDLAQRLAKIGKGQEAIKVLEKYRSSIRDQQSVDNVLIQIHIKLKQYAEALDLLEKKVVAIPLAKRGAETLRQMADCHIGLGHYDQAKLYLQRIIELTTENNAARKRLALCYIKEQCYHDAEQILAEVLKISPDDAQARELFEAAANSRTSETTIDLSDTSHEISKFARFFLDRCEVREVPSARRQGGKFEIVDIKRLEKLAGEQGFAGYYDDSAENYLSAAHIIFTDEELGNQAALSSFLLRSFVSRGDASIGSKLLDTIREWYCEALSFYDRIPKSDVSETDTQYATNALICFLQATLESREAIPIPRGANSNIPSIDQVLRDVWSQTVQAFRFFDFVAYLTSRSRYAKELLLPWIFAEYEPRELIFSYSPKRLGLPSLSSGEHSRQKLEDLWDKLDAKNQNERVRLYSDLNRIAQFEFKRSSLEEIISLIETLKGQLFLQLDRHRLEQQLHSILDLALRSCKVVSFDRREAFCREINDACRSLLDDIAKEPTKLSVEQLYGIVETIQTKTMATLKQMYESSMPQITAKLVLSSYTPDKLKQVTLQIAIENGEYGGPAESVELEVSGETGSTFILDERRFPLKEGSLGRGQRETRLVPVRLTDETISEGAFSLRVSVSYHTRSGEHQQTPWESLDIRLYPEHLFEDIPNPYTYAESGIVNSSDLFIGRDEIITKIAGMLKSTDCKAILLYGQKRAGKSSILHHLKLRLKQEEPNLLVLDGGSMGDFILGCHTQTPLLYQILGRILDKLKGAIDEKNRKCRDEPLEFLLPTRHDFYQDPNPPLYFQDIFEAFQKKAKETSGWNNVRVILLLDEFQEIYASIVRGHLPRDFMKYWTSLPERNFFSTVLVGQNVMTKVCQEFRNEFAKTQRERVSYLRPEDAEQLIDEPIRLGGKQGKTRYLEGSIKHILYLTAGSPYYIQIMCHRLVEHLNRKRAVFVTKADVDQVKSEMLHGKDAFDIGYFDNLITSGDPAEDKAYERQVTEIMACIAKKNQIGPCSKDEISSELGMDIDTILDDLDTRNVIQHEPGQGYTLRVGLFKEWLIAHR